MVYRWEIREGAKKASRGLAWMAHASCFVAGAYKGYMNAKGVDADVPFRYLWAPTAVLNAARAVSDDDYENDDSTLARIVKGSASGAILAPAEFALGYGAGHLIEWVQDKAFS